MIRYWHALLHGRFKLWQLLLLGTLWITGAIVFFAMATRDLGFDVTIASLALLIAGSGVAHFVLAWKALNAQRTLEVQMENPELAGKTKKSDARTSAPVQTPPRLGDDPFRDPPAPPPIVVVRHDKAVPAVPVVAGDSDDGPTYLG